MLGRSLFLLWSRGGARLLTLVSRSRRGHSGRLCGFRVCWLLPFSWPGDLVLLRVWTLVQFTHLRDKVLGHQERRKGGLKTHILGDVRHERIAVVKYRMPDRGTGLHLLHMSDQMTVLLFDQKNAIAGDNVLIFGVAVAGAGFGRHQNDVAGHPRNRALGERGQTDDLVGRYFLANTPVDREGMPVALGSSCPELNKVRLRLFVNRLGPGSDRGVTWPVDSLSAGYQWVATIRADLLGGCDPHAK